MFFVRTTTVADLPAISELLAETWHATYDPIYGKARVDEITRSSHTPEALRPRLDRPQSEFLVADDGKMIGGVAYAARTEKELVVLHQFYVRPSCQRQGIGRDLFAELETCFDGAKRMRVEVEPANDGAIGFYLSHGFAETGRADGPGAGGDRVAVIVMEKSLA